ncbi:cell division protein FtsB [Pseudorhodoferax sp. Leaf267]|uniref:cell division protein FtsB n=1 Tax=Pseudorhodoferax sp. Leaf267 TaxID=1736316 RepID=UPI0006FCF4B4|nr:cell division protein FtsB [Pseudorhodoferax sp. Leaf267]KQP22599.1 septation ring formation regulator EzrA [Pseudorhodoferax sp. Leaf267]
MGSRFVPAVLLVLLVVVHAQLWFGRGSISNVSDLQQRLETQKADNAKAQLANERLSAEVGDLKEGLEMVEEKARIELGMVKPNEVFVQLVR